MTKLAFNLPWPPTVNTYWRSVVISGHSRVLLSRDGRLYRDAVANETFRQGVPRGALTGKLAIELVAYPPDRRARDLDNLLKGSLDALKYSHVIRDDCDFDRIVIERGPVRPNGVLEVRIAEIPGAATVSASLPLEHPTGVEAFA